MQSTDPRQRSATDLRMMWQRELQKYGWDDMPSAHRQVIVDFSRAHLIGKQVSAASDQVRQMAIDQLCIDISRAELDDPAADRIVQEIPLPAYPTPSSDVSLDSVEFHDAQEFIGAENQTPGNIDGADVSADADESHFRDDVVETNGEPEKSRDDSPGSNRSQDVPPRKPRLIIISDDDDDDDDHDDEKDESSGSDDEKSSFNRRPRERLSVGGNVVYLTPDISSGDETGQVGNDGRSVNDVFDDEDIGDAENLRNRVVFRGGPTNEGNQNTKTKRKSKWVQNKPVWPKEMLNDEPEITLYFTQRDQIPVGPAFLEQRETIAKELFAEFNNNIFKNRLPRDTLVAFSGKLTSTAGYCRYHGNRDFVFGVSIALSKSLLDRYERLRSTLVHEMCHAAVALINHDYYEAHGRRFYRWGRIVSKIYPDITVTRCHDYKVQYNYLYQCTNADCGYIYGRRSQNIDTNISGCGYCKSRLVLLPPGTQAVPGKKQPSNHDALRVDSGRYQLSTNQDSSAAAKSKTPSTKRTPKPKGTTPSSNPRPKTGNRTEEKRRMTGLWDKVSLHD